MDFSSYFSYFVLKRCKMSDFISRRFVKMLDSISLERNKARACRFRQARVLCACLSFCPARSQLALLLMDADLLPLEGENRL